MFCIVLSMILNSVDAFTSNSPLSNVPASYPTAEKFVWYIVELNCIVPSFIPITRYDKVQSSFITFAYFSNNIHWVGVANTTFTISPIRVDTKSKSTNNWTEKSGAVNWL